MTILCPKGRWWRGWIHRLIPIKRDDGWVDMRCVDCRQQAELLPPQLGE